jgi:hypothetical protein
VYRDEVVARKRAHNALEDAKGKIRVYARVRPLLEFEAAKKQARTRRGAQGGWGGRRLRRGLCAGCCLLERPASSFPTLRPSHVPLPLLPPLPPKQTSQPFALAMPDELTVSHSWKDEKKPREYNFDGVFGPDASQDKVGAGVGAGTG